MSLDDFFAGFEASQPLFRAIRGVIGRIGHSELHIQKSQISFRRSKPFAWIWIPDRYLRGHHAPLVLSIVLNHRDPSPRWKEIVEPAKGRYMHHLEVKTVEDIDDEVRAWLVEAWLAAD